jgi:hypothetical protein
MHKMKKRSLQAAPHNPATSSAAPLSYPIPPAALLPPNCGILWTVQHLGQFFLDFHQPVGSHFHCRLIDLTVCTLPSEPRVHVPQIRDFLTKAGEVFQDVWHRFNLTPDSGSRRHFFLPDQQSWLPVPSLLAVSMSFIHFHIVSRHIVSCKVSCKRRASARRRTEAEEAKHGCLESRSFNSADVTPFQTAHLHQTGHPLDNSKLTS